MTSTSLQIFRTNAHVKVCLSEWFPSTKVKWNQLKRKKKMFCLLKQVEEHEGVNFYDKRLFHCGREKYHSINVWSGTLYGWRRHEANWSEWHNLIYFCFLANILLAAIHFSWKNVCNQKSVHNTFFQWKKYKENASITKLIYDKKNIPFVVCGHVFWFSGMSLAKTSEQSF